MGDCTLHLVRLYLIPGDLGQLHVHSSTEKNNRKLKETSSYMTDVIFINILKLRKGVSR